MLRKTTRLASLLLILLICVALFPACRKSDPLADNGFSSVTIHKKGEKVEATVTLSSDLVDTHKGTRAFLYELRPGEDISVLSGRDPLDSAKVRDTMDFDFPLIDAGGYNRVYSAFVIVFNDGSLLSDVGYWIENPERLATNQDTFLWKNSPKGLLVDDVDEATALGAMHAMLEVSLSALSSGSTPIDFGGATYPVSETELARLDAAVRAASASGMQTSLSIRLDTPLSPAHYAALIDFLTARYAGGEFGTLSAIFLCDTNVISTEQTALFCRVTNQALRSRVANGRVYVRTEEGGLTATKQFFATLDALLAAGGPMLWGAAVDLSDEQSAPWLASDDADRVTPLSLASLKEFLTRSGNTNYIKWFSVCGLSYSAADETLQAASFAYAYRVAASAGADLIFYADQNDDACGIYAADGTVRRIESVFSSIDTGLSVADSTLCGETVGQAWEKLSANTASRMTVGGLPSVSESGELGTTLFDFTGGDLGGFFAVGSIAPITVQPDPVTQTPALLLSIDPTASNAQGGIRKLLADASALDSVTSLTVRLQARGAARQKTNVTLSLEGVDANGTRISYRSTASVNNRTWQTVDFRITSFLAELDFASPVVLTLTAEPADDSTESIELWVERMGVTRLEKDNGVWVAIGVTLGGILVTAAIILLAYRFTVRRRRYGA